uniref:NADH dehydrogenase subunit 4L n=1 Tax=Selenophaedusa bavayi TaxID=1885694 RepID=A0A224A101_9EUPU|nr:NADH dehydrogenase subunit 4L [Selenophaedusa bavayi]
MNLLWFLMILLGLLFFRFFSCKNHYLSAVIILESLVLVSLLWMIIYSVLILESSVVFLIFLTLSVVEAAIGLSLLLAYMKAYSGAQIAVL